MDYKIIKEDELMHYGVKGMRWRKRTNYSTLDNNRPRGRKKNITGKGKGLYKKGKTGYGKVGYYYVGKLFGK